MTEPTEKHKEKARERCPRCGAMDCAWMNRTAHNAHMPHPPLPVSAVPADTAVSNAEIRKVLEGLSRVLRFRNGLPQRCWCEDPNSNWTHTSACVAARALYNRLQSAKES